MATSANILQLIQQQLPVALENQARATAAKVAEAEAGKEAAQAAQATMEQNAKDAALIATVEGTARLQTQQANAAALQAAGVTEGSNLILDMIGRIQTTKRELVQTLDARAAQQERQRTARLTQNPMDFLKGFLGVDEYAPAVQEQSSRLQALQTAVVNTNNVLQETFQTNLGAEQSVTAATIEARSRLVASEFQLKAQAAAVEALRYDSARYQAVAQLSESQLGMMYQVRSAQMAEQNHQLALQQFAWAKEKWSWEQAERQARKEAEEIGKRVDQVVLEKINFSRGGYGLPPLAGAEASMVLEMFRRGQAPKDMEFHYRNGERGMTVGMPMLGASPAETLQNLQSYAGNLPELVRETGGILLAAQEALAQSKDPRLKDPKNEEGRTQFINTWVREQLSAASQNVVPGSGNPFDIGDLRVHIGATGAPALPIAERLPTVQKILLPAAQSGVTLQDPRAVVRLVTAAVMKGDVTASQAAADLVNLYRAANEVNLVNRGFLRMGMIPPGAGRSYVVPFGQFGGKVDMTSFEEVSRALATSMARERGQNLGFGNLDPVSLGTALGTALRRTEPR